MKTSTLHLLFFCFPLFLTAQLPYTESFETDGNGTRYIADADLVCGSTDYFGRVDDFMINGVGSSTAADFAGEVGTKYWAGESHDDIVNGTPGTCNAGAGQTTKNIIFGPINITGISAIEVSALFAARQGTNWEGTEGMSLAYSFDNSVFTTGVFFGPVSTPDLEIREGGIESGIALSLNFANFSFSFANTANTQLWLRFSATNEASSEELAIDQIIVSETTLPVSLTDFNAKARNEAVVLNWETASELNNDYFQVEHSLDGRRFSSLGIVEGAGTSSQSQSYFFIHENPVRGINYYRLRQVDFDGRYEYSPVKVAAFQGANDPSKTKLTVFPNPVQDWLTIGLTPNLKLEEAIQFAIYNHTGQLIQRVYRNSDESIHIPVKALTAGYYILHAKQGRVQVSTGFIKR